jgi:hypothetical protein
MDGGWAGGGWVVDGSCDHSRDLQGFLVWTGLVIPVEEGEY